MDAREIDAFVAWMKTSKNRAKNSLYQYKSELTRFQKYLNGQTDPRHIADASGYDIRRFLADVGKGGPQNRRTRLSAISEYFKYLVGHDYRKDNPAEDVPLAKAPRRSSELLPLSRDEVKRLLETPDKHPGRDMARDKAILHALYSGLKLEECRSLLVRNIDFGMRQVKVSGRKMPVNLTQEATDVFAAYIEERTKKESPALFPGRNGHLSAKQIATTVGKHGRLCALNGRITAEKMRASFALHAIESRVGLVELIDALGKFDDVWLRQIVDIARPRMIASEIGLPASRVYVANRAYDFFADVAAEIGRARAAVLIVDPYPSEDFFRRYVSNTPPGVGTRILTNGTKRSGYAALDPSVEGLARLFAASHTLEVRISTQLHDRHIFIDGRGWVVGQSIKDAAAKSATYVIELPDPELQELRDVDESVWKAAKKVI